MALPLSISELVVGASMMPAWAVIMGWVWLGLAMLYASRWILWLLFSIVMGTIQLVITLYMILRIAIDLALLSLLHAIIRLGSFTFICFQGSSSYKMYVKLKQCESYEEYENVAERIDENSDWRRNTDDFPQGQFLKSFTDEMRANRERGDAMHVMYMLSGVMRRNHLGIDEQDLYDKTAGGTKYVITEYLNEIKASLEWIASLVDDRLSLKQGITFFRKASRALGQTALCLSGGGSIAMYHMGVLRALVQQGLYHHIHVISGASGGSIVAGMVAMLTEEELLDKVLVSDVSTDFRRTGEMKKKNIRWFPPLHQQMMSYIRTGYLIDNKEFQRTCHFYYGDLTFAEAYEHTRKHVCIAVSASRFNSAYNVPQRLLLNHVSTPHVLIRSAVAASCALPGIMAPNRLLMKDSKGVIGPFEVDGVEWIDGSLQADVPYKRMSTLFGVSNFIVSQTNFHVLPLIGHKLQSGLPGANSSMRNLMNAIDLDLRHRAQFLSELKLLPRLYGQDFGGMFKQKYHGNVTIVPALSITESLGLKVVINPSVADMKSYIKGGMRATWRHIPRVKNMTCIERTLYQCLEMLLSSRPSVYIELSSQPEEHPVDELRDAYGSPRHKMLVSDMLLGGNDIVGEDQQVILRGVLAEEPLDSDTCIDTKGTEKGDEFLFPSYTYADTLNEYSVGLRQWRERIAGSIRNMLHEALPKNESQEMKEMQKRLEALERENAKLRAQLNLIQRGSKTTENL